MISYMFKIGDGGSCRSHFGSSHFFCSRLSSIHIAFRAWMDRLDRSIEADPPLDPRSDFILVELQKQQLDKIAAVDAACRSCGVNPQLSYINAQDSRSLTGQITVSAAFERFPGVQFCDRRLSLKGCVENLKHTFCILTVPN